MNQVRDNSMVPPGGRFIYVHEDGYQQSHPYLMQLRKDVKKYRRINQLPIGQNFNEEFEANVCSHAHDSVCVDVPLSTVVDKAARLISALARWSLSGFQVRKAEEVERIRDLCQACPKYGGEKGFLKVICSECGCSNKKLYLATEHCPLRPPKW